ncbi:hypothetical protein [Naasia sp. SYSU D00948]|uniref:DUF7882 family protein n=1 Tax=Naasia sp. SYSU D00948 TaxID=2817379 RepID=UPI001B313EB7|nr:hypothetical protein [Naasia sp. SYSU D00948]
MGSLIYGVAPAIRIEDRVLRHLQAVIVGKLRRGESFSFNWDQEPGVGEDEATDEAAAHGTVWIGPASQLYFRYDGPRDGHVLNREWLEVLMRASNSAGGLHVVPEPVQQSGAADAASASHH